MLDFIFFKIIYPIFWKQIDALLDHYRLAQVHSIDNTPAGLVYIDVTKEYSPGTELLIYSTSTHIFDPDDPQRFLGALEKVVGTARVVQGSRAIMTRINGKLELGLLVKSANSDESVFSSFKERLWTK